MSQANPPQLERYAHLLDMADAMCSLSSRFSGVHPPPEEFDEPAKAVLSIGHLIATLLLLGSKYGVGAGFMVGHALDQHSSMVTPETQNEVDRLEEFKSEGNDRYDALVQILCLIQEELDLARAARERAQSSVGEWNEDDWGFH